MSDVGDTSEYVKELANCLLAHIKNMRANLVEQYYIYYLNKIVDLVQFKFFDNLWEAKKLNDIGIQRLQLDVFELKTILINFLKIDSDKKKITTGMQNSYTSNVNKKMAKIENVLKLLAMNTDQFAANARNFLERDAPEIEKIMIMKGLKKTDNFINKLFSGK
jgi:hypothetical protein